MTQPDREELAGRLEEAIRAAREFYMPNATVSLLDAVKIAAALRQSPSVEEVARRTCHCRGVDFGTYEAQVELVPPDILRREDGRGICVDVCLALEVTQLWRHGIRTTGCCCGHGKLEPTICVGPEDAEAMRGLGYVNTPLLPGRPDAFTAKTGWPAGRREAC